MSTFEKRDCPRTGILPACTSLLKSRISRKSVGRVPWGQKVGFVVTWTGFVGRRSGARGAMSVSASNSGGRVS